MNRYITSIKICRSETGLHHTLIQDVNKYSNIKNYLRLLPHKTSSITVFYVSMYVSENSSRQLFKGSRTGHFVKVSL